jgi:hypothetical protein
LRGFEVLECVLGFGCAACRTWHTANFLQRKQWGEDLQRLALLINHRKQKIQKQTKKPCGCAGALVLK